MADVAELEAELIQLVSTVPEFTMAGFSVFNLNDFQAQSAGQTLPVVGVSYDGATTAGPEGTPTNSRSSAAAVLTVQFIVVVAMQYNYTGQDDTKQKAFSLMSQVRGVVLGYQGANTRPWRFIAEQPEPEASGDGLIVYSQVWQTTLPITGNFNKV